MLSTLLCPLLLSSSLAPMHRHHLLLSRLIPHPPSRVRCLQPVKFRLHQCPSHSSPSHLANLPFLQPPQLWASQPFTLVLLPLLRAPSNPEHRLLPLSLDLFHPLGLLPPPLQLDSIQALCPLSNNPLQPSHSLITQVHHLQGLKCLLLQWLKATTCLQDHRALQGPLGPYSNLSLACREDTHLSRMVNLLLMSLIIFYWEIFFKLFN